MKKLSLKLTKESLQRLDLDQRSQVNGGEPNESRYASRCVGGWPFWALYY